MAEWQPPSVEEQIVPRAEQYVMRAQSQINALTDKQVQALASERTRWEAVEQGGMSVSAFTDALREENDERDYQVWLRSPAGQQYEERERDIDRAIGRMERREQGDLEATMTPAQWETWRESTPEQRETFKEHLRAELIRDTQAQGVHGAVAVVTPEEDTAFYVQVPFNHAAWLQAQEGTPSAYVPHEEEDFQRHVERTESQRETLSPGERLIAYYTDLKAHLREQEQRELPLDASERRQEVLAFAEQWQAQHGPIHDAAQAVQRDYAAVQEHVAERQEARESVVEPMVAQRHETGRSY